MATNLFAIVHKPSIKKEKKIALKIKGKERLYYELDDNGLLYKNIGKQFALDDSIQIGIYTRTIKAPSGKKSRNYGLRVQIDDNPPFELRYKKKGSRVTSPDRPGWNYTKSGIWYIYIPNKPGWSNIKILPMRGNPVVYVRLISNKIDNKGKVSEIIRTVNTQNRVSIKNLDKNTSTKWYALNKVNQQQFEIEGPTKIRVFSRLQFDQNIVKDDYYIYVRENGIDLGTYYFQTEKSKQSKNIDSSVPISKWRSLWINVPKGKHYYTFSMPQIDNNQDKTIFLRLKQWEEN
tara:strand:- start:2081 stop:2950 length:870 start_codon:yes stop_codon:yes gene_type:complete